MPAGSARKNGLLCSKFYLDTLIRLEFCSVPETFSALQALCIFATGAKRGKRVTATSSKRGENSVGQLTTDFGLTFKGEKKNEINLREVGKRGQERETGPSNKREERESECDRRQGNVLRSSPPPPVTFFPTPTHTTCMLQIHQTNVLLVVKAACHRLESPVAASGLGPPQGYRTTHCQMTYYCLCTRRY